MGACDRARAGDDRPAGDDHRRQQRRRRARRDPARLARPAAHGGAGSDCLTRCLQSSGASWYETMGESLSATCPEALAMPRRALAAARVRRAADDRAGGLARPAAAAGLAARLPRQRRRSRFRRQRRRARRRGSGGDQPRARGHRAAASGIRVRPGRIARIADRERRRDAAGIDPRGDRRLSRWSSTR